MPNWCTNRVHISGNEEIVQDFISFVKGTGEDGTFSFNAIIPTPQELIDTEASFGSEEHQEKHAANKEKYGYAHWYDYQCDKWGTKWDVNDPDHFYDGGDYAEWEFLTAWGPPEGIYNTLSTKYHNQDLSISWFYDEPGMQIAGYL